MVNKCYRMGLCRILVLACVAIGAEHQAIALCGTVIDSGVQCDRCVGEMNTCSCQDGPCAGHAWICNTIKGIQIGDDHQIVFIQQWCNQYFSCGTANGQGCTFWNPCIAKNLLIGNNWIENPVAYGDCTNPK